MAFNPILQFIMVTALISGLWIMWAPVISSIAYENTLLDNASAQSKVIRDAFWSFGMALPAVAMAYNVVSFFSYLKKREAVAE